MKTFGIVISLSFSLSETKKKVYFKVDFFKSFSVLLLLGSKYLFKYLIFKDKSNSKQGTRLHVFVFFIHQPISLSIGT